MNAMTVRLRAWLAIFAVAVGVYFIGRWQGAASVADAVAVQDARTILALKRPYLERQQKRAQREQQYVRNMQSLHGTADSLRTLAVHADTLVLPDSGPVSLWRATANAEREGAMQCVLALATCGERAHAAEMRAAALDSMLGNVLRVKDCRVLFVKCPSRFATFLVGAGLGFIGGAWIEKK